MGDHLPDADQPPVGQGLPPVLAQLDHIVGVDRVQDVVGFAAAFQHPIQILDQAPPDPARFAPSDVRRALGLQPAARAVLRRNADLPVPRSEKVLSGEPCVVQGQGPGRMLGNDGQGGMWVELQQRAQGQAAIPVDKIVWSGAGRPNQHEQLALRNAPRAMPPVDPATLQPGTNIRYLMQASGYQTVAAKGVFQGLGPDGKAVIEYDRKQRVNVRPEQVTLGTAEHAVNLDDAPPADVYGGLEPNQVLALPPWLNRALQAATDAQVCNDHKASDYINSLQGAGYQCFVVGGAVRDVIRVLMRPDAYDELKGGNPKFARYDTFQEALTTEPGLIREVMKDIDVVTTAPMSEIKRLSPEQDQRNVRTRGDTSQKYGIVTYKGDHDVEGIDIATMRSFGMFSKNDCAFDHDIATDTFSRDFGCNMLMYDPQRGVIVDAMARDDNSSGLADAANQSLSLANNNYVHKNDMLALRAMKFQPRGYEYAPESMAMLEDNFRSFYEFPDDPDLQDRRLNKLGSNVARICKIGINESNDALEAWVKDKLQPSMRALNLGDYYDAHIDPDAHGRNFVNRIALGRITRYPDHWDRQEKIDTKVGFVTQASGLPSDALSQQARQPVMEGVVARVGSNSAGSYTALAPYLAKLFDGVLGNVDFKPIREALKHLKTGLDSKTFVAADLRTGNQLRDTLAQLDPIATAEDFDAVAVGLLMNALSAALGVIGEIRCLPAESRELEDIKSALAGAAETVKGTVTGAIDRYQPSSGKAAADRKLGLDGFFAEVKVGVAADKMQAAGIQIADDALDWLIENGVDDPQAFGSLFYFLSFHGNALPQPFTLTVTSGAMYASAIQQKAMDEGLAAAVALGADRTTFKLPGGGQVIFPTPQGNFAPDAVNQAVEELKNA